MSRSLQNDRDTVYTKNRRFWRTVFCLVCAQGEMPILKVSGALSNLLIADCEATEWLFVLTIGEILVAALERHTADDGPAVMRHLLEAEETLGLQAHLLVAHRSDGERNVLSLVSNRKLHNVPDRRQIVHLDILVVKDATSGTLETHFHNTLLRRLLGLFGHSSITIAEIKPRLFRDGDKLKNFKKFNAARSRKRVSRRAKSDCLG